MPERFDHSVDLSTPPTAVRWDLGEQPVLDRPREKVCAVRIGERDFGIPARFIRGLRHVELLTPVPRAPAHVLGITYIQGAILPLIDAGAALGVSGPRHGPPWTALWVIVETLSVLLAIDQIVAFEPLAPSVREGKLETSSGGYARGTAALFGDPVPLLDLPRLLADLKGAGTARTRP